VGATPGGGADQVIKCDVHIWLLVDVSSCVEIVRGGFQVCVNRGCCTC
jgi:hypothetical protein